jgi:hypothetical protein
MWVFEDRVMKVTEPKTSKVTGWRILHNEEVYELEIGLLITRAMN